MSRIARFLKDGVCYYIQSQGYRGQKVFKGNLDYDWYVQLLKKYKLRFKVNIYAYCLMPQEIHFLVHPSDSSKLSVFMQGLNQSYALYFNARYSRVGKVWGQRYKSHLIYRDEDLFQCIKAVEFLPVQAKHTDSPVKYSWSSCSQRILGSAGIIDSMPPIILD